MEQLPTEQLRDRPSLRLYHAWALLLSGRSLDAIASQFGDVEADAELGPQVALLHALRAVYRGQASAGAELARRALERLPEDDAFARGIAAWTLGMAYLADGDVEAGTRLLDDAARTAGETGNVLAAVQALRYLSGARIQAGRLYEAQALLDRALILATDEEGHRLPVAGEVLIVLGELSRRWNELSAASRYLIEGIERTRQGRDVVALSGYISLAQVRQAQGDSIGARDAIDTARRLAERTDATHADDRIVALIRARLDIIRGDLPAAIRWAEERGLWRENALSAPDEGDMMERQLRTFDQVLLAWLLIEYGQPGKALSVLESYLPKAERERQVGLLIEIQSLRALAFQAQGERDRALGALEHALSLAEPGGDVRTFLDKGTAMAQLLYQAAARGIAPAYAGRILASTEYPARSEQRRGGASGFKLPATSASNLESECLIEPLSAREVQVLALMAEGATNREIAQRLSISLNTVKGHTRKIYGKLGVHSRMQAVARARITGILPDL
jgi:LuxR family maltose regulon positive regulatory protein